MIVKAGGFQRCSLWKIFSFLLLIALGGRQTVARQKKSRIENPHAEDAPLFLGYDNALPSYIFNKLATECNIVGKWTSDQSLLAHNKKQTFWLPTETVLTRSAENGKLIAANKQRPRNSIERAVLHLKRYVNMHPELYSKSGGSAPKIIGAEWWVQIRTGSEDIGFHYDKDEGLASLRGIMKHPAVSTVTYLSDVGAPTLIFNMTTPDGNIEIPAIPDEGVLSYPKENRHILFRGNLQHGVVGSASTRSSAASIKKRVTLLINWWAEKPIEPNTVLLSDDLAQKMGLLHFDSKTGLPVGVQQHNSQTQKHVVDIHGNEPILEFSSSDYDDGSEDDVASDIVSSSLSSNGMSDDGSDKADDINNSQDIDDNNDIDNNDDDETSVDSARSRRRRRLKSKQSDRNRQLNEDNAEIDASGNIRIHDREAQGDANVEQEGEEGNGIGNKKKKSKKIKSANKVNDVEDILTMITDPSWNYTAVNVTPLVIPPQRDARRHQIEFPPGDMHFFYLPHNMKSGAYSIKWGDDQAYGAVGMLDLFRQNQVDQLFQLPQPKILILYRPEDKYIYSQLLDAVLPFAKRHVDTLKIYFCPYDKCADAARAFGLNANDLPRFVFDHTARNEKFVQKREDFAPTYKSLENFYNYCVKN